MFSFPTEVNPPSGPVMINSYSSWIADSPPEYSLRHGILSESGPSTVAKLHLTLREVRNEFLRRVRGRGDGFFFSSGWHSVSNGGINFHKYYGIILWSRLEFLASDCFLFFWDFLACYLSRLAGTQENSRHEGIRVSITQSVLLYMCSEPVTQTAARGGGGV